MKKKILVIGSIAIDTTIMSNSMPQAGTTTIANSYFTNVGGKGANQACASLFLGGSVSFIGAIGKDSNGELVKKCLKEHKLNARLKESNYPTGVAFITLDAKGENQILIIQGANIDLTKEDVDVNDDLFQKGDILLIQLESVPETVQYAIKKAHEKGMIVVFNPAPVKEFDKSYYQYIDYIVPNEHEIQQLTKLESIEEGAKYLLDNGCKNVIVTLGENGSVLINSGGICRVNAHKVKAIDTTAAGDSYLGALVTKLASGKDIIEAMEFASLASSFTVTKKGAIIALPHLKDLSR